MNMLIYGLATYPIFLFYIYFLIRFHFGPRKSIYRANANKLIYVGLFSWITSLILKIVISSPRPDLSEALFIPASMHGFPSGHAAIMFGLAFLAFSFDKRAGFILIFIAGLTGIARVLSEVHFWYDIIGGVALGFIVAYIVNVNTKKVRH